eukprot:ctg_2119.g537
MRRASGREGKRAGAQDVGTARPRSDAFLAARPEADGCTLVTDMATFASVSGYVWGDRVVVGGVGVPELEGSAARRVERLVRLGGGGAGVVARGQQCAGARLRAGHRAVPREQRPGVGTVGGAVPVAAVAADAMATGRAVRPTGGRGVFGGAVRPADTVVAGGTHGHVLCRGHRGAGAVAAAGGAAGHADTGATGEFGRACGRAAGRRAAGGRLADRQGPGSPKTLDMRGDTVCAGFFGGGGRRCAPACSPSPTCSSRRSDTPHSVSATRACPGNRRTQTRG